MWQAFCHGQSLSKRSLDAFYTLETDPTIELQKQLMNIVVTGCCIIHFSSTQWEEREDVFVSSLHFDAVS